MDNKLNETQILSQSRRINKRSNATLGRNSNPQFPSHCQLLFQIAVNEYV